MRSKVYQLVNLLLVCVATLCWQNLALASPVNICGSEIALFHCKVGEEGDLAICPSYGGEELTGIQYRFSRKGRKELVFPALKYDLTSFKKNIFFRYQTEYKFIKFPIGSYTYSIYSDYDEAEIYGNNRSAGVLVNDLRNSVQVQIPCEEIYVDRLGKVIPLLECDTEDAMGCG